MQTIQHAPIPKGIFKDKPTMEQVARYFFADQGNSGDMHWVLFNNGTIYTELKSKYPEVGRVKGAGDLLVAKILDKSRKAELETFDGNDKVGVYRIDEFSHPTYIIKTILQERLCIIVVGETKIEALSEQQLAAVGYLGRAKYQMDCEENKIIATSFPWSAQTNK